MFVSLESIFCCHIFANMYKLSVIVIDKPMDLGGTIFTSVPIFMPHLCTIILYHPNKRFETVDNA